MTDKHPAVRAFLKAEAKRETARGVGRLDIIAAKTKVSEGELRDILLGEPVSDEIARAIYRMWGKFPIEDNCDCDARFRVNKFGDPPITHAFDCPARFAETNRKLAGLDRECQDAYNRAMNALIDNITLSPSIRFIVLDDDGHDPRNHTGKHCK